MIATNNIGQKIGSQEERRFPEDLAFWVTQKSHDLKKKTPPDTI